MIWIAMLTILREIFGDFHSCLEVSFVICSRGSVGALSKLPWSCMSEEQDLISFYSSASSHLLIQQALKLSGKSK